MAFIGESVVSTLVEELTTIAIEELRQEVRLVVGVKDQVEKLTKNLRSIQTVLVDAEQRQLKNPDIRLWLDDLKEISYEMDDVLDKWRSSMLLKSRDHEDKSDPPTTSSHAMRKLCSFITSCCVRCGKIGLRRDIALKIKDINESLIEIADRRKKYQVTPYVGGSVGEQVHGGRSTISDVNIAEVYGRAKDEKKIINMLLGESSSTASVVPQIISIVGMGGLGKTTLAQLAYNNATVEEHFDARVWLCVSDPFDEIKIATEILKSLGGSDGSQLQTMVQDIKNKTSGKMFLLVLDDVWNEDYVKWEKVKAAFVCGLPGSTILITTRKENVAKIMGCVESNLHRPGCLSTEECWSIISKMVLSSGMPVEELRWLEEIGRRIADKCKGLPLAAKALGGLLHSKVSRQEWQSVLDSEMWELGVDEAEIDKHLFAPLWLSYHDLSPAERQCLSLCSLFPKDYLYQKELQISLWVAQGYVRDAKTKEMDMVGQQYIQNLSTRSFFQDIEKDDAGLVWRFQMHDIVHDFVQYISRKECLFLRDDDAKDESLGSLHKSIRHLFFSSSNQSIYSFPNSIFCFKKLRTLSIVNGRKIDMHSLVNELTCLRSLILEECDFEEIPSMVGKLIHLRYLSISWNWQLSELPETVGDLCNLLILVIKSVNKIKKLPRGIEKLSNLRVLEYTEMIRLTQGIGRLNSLRKSPSFIVDERPDVNGEVASLGYLKSMNSLRALNIRLRRNVKHVDGAKRAELNQKKHLVYLELLLAGGEEEAEKYDEEVIEALQPCSNLEELLIHNYKGANYNPSWLLSLNNLRKVKFSNWENCKCLPSLGMLPSLASLELHGVDGVKRVGEEFLGIETNKDLNSSSVVVFPKLEMLNLDSLEEWEEWEMDEWGHFTIMPNLTHLYVRYCIKLKALPHHLLQMTTLNCLDINGSNLLYERYNRYKGVESHKISHIPDFNEGFFTNLR